MGVPSPAPAADGEPLPRRLPVALLYLQGPALGSHAWDPIARSLSERFPSLQVAARQLLFCAPDPPSPELFDLALEAAGSILGLANSLAPLSDLRLLVLPGEVDHLDGKTELVHDPVVDELLELPSLPLDPGVFLTSRAALSLEWSWKVEEAGQYSCRAGPVLPLLQLVGREETGGSSFRNTELLGRETPFVPRPQLSAALDEAIGTGSVRVTGPLGSGKSRLVDQVLRSRPGHAVRAAPGDPSRSLAEKLVRAVLAVTSNPSRDVIISKLAEVEHERRRTRAASYLLQLLQAHCKNRRESLTVVVDDVERVSGPDLAMLRQLTAAGLPAAKLALVLVGRDGGDWIPASGKPAEVRVPYMDDDAMAVLVEYVCEPLDMPDTVVERFVEASGGNPFAFEEGILELVHLRSLRRIYGSFFFGGPETTGYEPSRRLVAHVLAETHRLGQPEALLSLAAADIAVPSEAIETGADRSWVDIYRAAGWVVDEPSPWGPGVRLGYQAVRAALRHSLTPPAAQRLRQDLGHLLLGRGDSVEARWSATQLLAGTEEGARSLIAIASPLPPEALRGDVYAALDREIETVRQRNEDPALEIDMLWALLPLARRLGRVHETGESLDRALELAQEHPKRWVAFAALKADLDIEEGRPREAEAHLKRALQVAVKLGSRRRSVLAVQLARLLVQQERMDEAKHLLEHLIVEASDQGSSSTAATCRFYLGNIAMHQGRYEDALSLHRRALDEREQQRLVASIGASLSALGATTLRMGNYPEALEHYERASDHLAQYGRPGEASYAKLGIGRVLSRLGEPTMATGPLREALTLRVGHDTSIGEAIARLEVAENSFELDRVEDAHELVRRALFQLRMVEEHPTLGDAEQLLGRILLKQRRYDEAKEHLQAAVDLHTRHKKPRQAIRDLGWLLAEARARGVRSEVEVLVRRLEEALERGPYPVRGELDDYRLFEALEWLEKLGSKTPSPPVLFLRRAYRELMRKTSYLDVERRNTYLLQVTEHADIVEAATRYRLSLPTSI